MSEKTFNPNKRSLTAAGSSVLSAFLVLFLWKSDAININTAYLLAIIPVSLMFLAIVFGIGNRETRNHATRRYLGRMALVMAFYLITLFLAEHMIDYRGVTGIYAALLASLPGLSFAGVIWIFGGLIAEETDEFYRMLYIRQGLIATGISFTLAAIWGFLETYRVVEHVAAFWWPTLWCVGLGVGAVSNKIKYGVFGEIR